MKGSQKWLLWNLNIKIVAFYKIILTIMPTRTSITNTQAMTDTFELQNSDYSVIQDSDWTPIYHKWPTATTNETWEQIP